MTTRVRILGAFLLHVMQTPVCVQDWLTLHATYVIGMHAARQRQRRMVCCILVHNYCIGTCGMFIICGCNACIVTQIYILSDPDLYVIGLSVTCYVLRLRYLSNVELYVIEMHVTRTIKDIQYKNVSHAPSSELKQIFPTVSAAILCPAVRIIDVRNKACSCGKMIRH